MAKSVEEVVNFTLPPTLQRFMASTAFIRGVRGPVGSGKSTGCCMAIANEATLMPADKKGVRRSRIGVIRSTYRELQDTTIKTWLEWFPEATFGAFHHNDSAHYVRFRMPDKTEVHLDMLFRALDRPDDIKKLKSLELTGAWINEATETPVEIFEMLEGRVGRFPRRKDVPNYRKYIIMDTNPPDTDHWWYKLAEEFTPKLRELQATGFTSYQTALEELFRISGSDAMDARSMDDKQAREMFLSLCDKYEFFAQPSGLSKQAENTENLSANYYHSLALGKQQEWVNVFIKGQYGFVQDGKPVYPEYTDSVHYNERLTGPDKQNKIIIRGWDGGRTPACIFTQLTPDGRLFAFDELIGVDIGLTEFADRVKKHSAVHCPNAKFVDIGDPSIFFKSQLEDRAPSVILSAKGINLEAGIQSPTIRKESVKKLLREQTGGKQCFQIGPKCNMLRKGLMGGYQYKRKQVSGTEYQEKPNKNAFSHPTEAFEYICTRLFAGSVIEEDFDYGEIENQFGINKGKDAIPSGEGRSSVTGY